MSYDYNALTGKIVTSRRKANELDEAYIAATKEEDDDAITKQKPALLAAYQESINALTELSDVCPMTPLFWMQYANDTARLLEVLSTSAASARDAQMQVIELGLTEFPGSAIMQLYFLQVLCNQAEDSADDELKQKVDTSFQSAFRQIGHGSHRNEDTIVAHLYRTYANYLIENDRVNDALATFVQRASIPMKDENDGISGEYQEFCQEHQIPPATSRAQLQHLEGARRNVSKLYGSFATIEDELDSIMHQEQILSRHQVKLPDDLDTIDWRTVLRSDDKTCWMGYGGMGTATTFLRYARACGGFKLPGYQDGDDDDNDDAETDGANEYSDLKQGLARVKDLTFAVYERAIAECPTIETVWAAYAKHLQYVITGYTMAENKKTSKKSPNPKSKELLQASAAKLAARLRTVMGRAVRNCPYSASLFQTKLEAYAIYSKHCPGSPFDAEDLSKIVKEGLSMKFITAPELCVELYMTAISLIRSKILSASADAVGKPFDGHEGVSIAKPSKDSGDMDEDVEGEIQDLCEDLSELYEQVDEYIRKNHKPYSKGRAGLFFDKAFTETHLLEPLQSALSEEGAPNASNRVTARVTKMVQTFQRVLKVHKPANPDVYLSFINALMATYPVSSPLHVISKFRQVRHLYQDALKSVGPGRPDDPTSIAALQQLQSSSNNPQRPDRDYYVALTALCHEYMTFEYYFGSKDSFTKAKKAVDKKIQTHLKKHPQPTVATDVSSLHRVEDSGAPASETGMEVEETSEGTTKVKSHKRKKDDHDADQHTPNATTAPAANEHVGDSQDGTEGIRAKRRRLAREAGVSAPAATESIPPPSTDDGDDNAGTAEVAKPKKHTVRIGKLEHPAHPFTVRVSNLKQTVEDMDVVDLLRSRCGAIVHVKIMREKVNYGKGKSKGWALVQFEERESVEKAIELNEMIGLHDKLVSIQRSHMPAVSLVPSGMHRVNPKGQGKSTKQNIKRKQDRGGTNMDVDAETKPEGDSNTDAVNVDSKKEAGSSSTAAAAPKKASAFLGFQPRVVRRQKGGSGRKPKIGLGASKHKSK